LLVNIYRFTLLINGRLLRLRKSVRLWMNE
jgi:hypothetical protein